MYGEIITKCCKKYELSETLVRAIIQTESLGDTYAARHEPGYIWTYKVQEMADKARCTKGTMDTLQKTSFGLMQVMGAVYVEYVDKLQNDFSYLPTALINPEINLEFGCMHLRNKINELDFNPLDAFAAYNAGSVRKVEGKYVNQRSVGRFERIYKQLGGEL